MQHRGRIAALLELGAGFHRELTGRENVYLNASFLGLSRAQTDRIYDDIVDFSELEKTSGHPVKFYSSGMYVRLAFAVAVHVDPEILLIDEVLAVGDEPFQRRCLDRIRRFHAEGRTIVLVTHALDQVRDMCDEAVMLDNGRVHSIGAPEDVVRVLRHRLLSDDPTFVAEEGTREVEIVGVAIESESGLRDTVHPGEGLTITVDLRAEAPSRTRRYRSRSCPPRRTSTSSRRRRAIWGFRRTRRREEARTVPDSAGPLERRVLLRDGGVGFRGRQALPRPDPALPAHRAGRRARGAAPTCAPRSRWRICERRWIGAGRWGSSRGAAGTSQPMLIALILLSVTLAAVRPADAEARDGSGGGENGRPPAGGRLLEDHREHARGLGGPAAVRVVCVRLARRPVADLPVVRVPVRVAHVRADPARRPIHPGAGGARPSGGSASASSSSGSCWSRRRGSREPRPGRGASSMRAVVLVGGEGTRLRPLTETVPKPLLPLVDRPILDHVLDHLVLHGVDEVIMSSPYLEETFHPFISSRGTPAITWITEREPLGTGGAIVSVLDRLDEPFFALNGDILTDLDLGAMVTSHRDRSAAVTIALHHVDDARAFGLVETEPDGRVTAFREKPRDPIPGDVNAGTYLLDPTVLRAWQPGTTISIETEIFPALIRRGVATFGFPPTRTGWISGRRRSICAPTSISLAGRLAGSDYAAPWIDPGATVDATARVASTVAVGPGSSIAAGAAIEASVLLDGASVGEGARVADSILGPGSAVGPTPTSGTRWWAPGARIPSGARLHGDRIAAG